MFTTIGNWQPAVAGRHVPRATSIDWSKHHEFLKFIDLPRPDAAAVRAGPEQHRARRRQAAGGARLARARRARRLAATSTSTADYIGRSRAEFTVAKDQNVRLRSGWFSDRSATYLAAGRPVVTQDTGFGKVLPTGEGLFALLDDGGDRRGGRAINADYDRHAPGGARDRPRVLRLRRRPRTYWSKKAGASRGGRPHVVPAPARLRQGRGRSNRLLADIRSRRSRAVDAPANQRRGPAARRRVPVGRPRLGVGAARARPACKRRGRARRGEDQQDALSSPWAGAADEVTRGTVNADRRRS